jgi:hypothetical protein
MMYATKGIYYGQLRRGQMQGAGVYTWADGSTYKGQFNADMWHGSALFITKSGTRFAGIPLTSATSQRVRQVVRVLRAWQAD